jgi:hypothetical protein
MTITPAKEGIDFSIKPELITPNIPTSEWPLLLKDYDKRQFRDFPATSDSFYLQHHIMISEMLTGIQFSLGPVILPPSRQDALLSNVI